MHSPAGFVSAAAHSEALWQQVRHGEAPEPVTSAETARVRHDALKAIARDIPDPHEFAMQLAEPWCDYLRRAFRSQDPENVGCLRTDERWIGDLFAMGLCDKRGFLTVFGMSVRREIMVDEG